MTEWFGINFHKIFGENIRKKRFTKNVYLFGKCISIWIPIHWIFINNLYFRFRYRYNIRLLFRISFLPTIFNKELIEISFSIWLSFEMRYQMNINFINHKGCEWMIWVEIFAQKYSNFPTVHCNRILALFFGKRFKSI